MSDIDFTEMPQGLNMALAKNMDAMRYFASLPPDKQRELINRTHLISSKEEMQAFVDSFTGSGPQQS